MSQPKITKYAINANSGAYVSIPATIWCRRLEIVEDGAATAQGLTITLPDDNFTQIYTVTSALQPFKMPDKDIGINTLGDSMGKMYGAPAQTVAPGDTRAADVLCKVRSNSATATTICVREWN